MHTRTQNQPKPSRFFSGFRAGSRQVSSSIRGRMQSPVQRLPTRNVWALMSKSGRATASTVGTSWLSSKPMHSPMAMRLKVRRIRDLGGSGAKTGSSAGTDAGFIIVRVAPSVTSSSPSATVTDWQTPPNPGPMLEEHSLPAMAVTQITSAPISMSPHAQWSPEPIPGAQKPPVAVIVPPLITMLPQLSLPPPPIPAA